MTTQSAQSASQEREPVSYEVRRALEHAAAVLESDHAGMMTRRAVAEGLRALAAAPQKAAGAAEQAFDLYVQQAEAIRDLLDKHAPETTGNLQTRLAAVLSAQPAAVQQGAEPVAWIGPFDRAMSNAAYQGWLKQYPDIAVHWKPLYASPPPAAPAVPEGYVLVAVKNLEPLVDALERADRKGYLPDAMAAEWEAFQYCGVAATPQPAEPTAPHPEK